jgi:hypothetical protein
MPKRPLLIDDANEIRIGSRSAADYGDHWHRLTGFGGQETCWDILQALSANTLRLMADFGMV